MREDYIECEVAPFYRAKRCPSCPDGLLIVYDEGMTQCTQRRRVYRCHLCNVPVALTARDWPRVMYRVPIAKGIIDSDGSLERSKNG